MTTEQAVLRISKEVTDIQRGNDLSLAVAFRDENVRNVKALIIGPPDTPYEFGFFEFHLHFGKDYPTKAPGVRCMTTNGGRTRFNPNIYAEGKVCLSILGTWRGDPGEEWRSTQGLESLLLSIQSLMSSNPYENEPGFEEQREEREKREARIYAAKIRHETLRISIIKRLEVYLGIDGPLRKEGSDEPTPAAKPSKPSNSSFNDTSAIAHKNYNHIIYGNGKATSGSTAQILASLQSSGSSKDSSTTPDDDNYEPFVDLCKRRFLWYYQIYLASITSAQAKKDCVFADGTRFTVTAFECAANGMDGKYEYGQLEKRLVRVRAALDEETASWAAQGATAHARENPTALKFSRKLRHVQQELASGRNGDGGRFNVEAVDGNPFVWRLQIIGKPMTQLDGGIFFVRMTFPFNFPNQQPRVVVETPLFHQRVSPEGVLCYFASREDKVLSHVLGVIEAIEEEEPRYDPRTLVNPEAAALLWSKGDEGKKMYNRKLRRSAQDSTEM